MTTKTDVIIVGAGPTGLSLAVQLIRYNIPFVIFDRQETITDLSKALVVHARTLEIYEQVGLAQKAVEGGQILQKSDLISGGKVRGSLDFTDVGTQLSAFPFFLIFEQSKNERLLYDYLQHHGKDVLWQTEMESLKQDANGVTVVTTTNGETQTIEAKYLVGCDGASSPTRHFLNLAFEGSTNPRRFYVADVELDYQGDRTSMDLCFGHNSFMLMLPMQEEKQWRFIGNLPEYNEQRSDEITYREIEAKVRELIQRPLTVENVNWFSSYKVHTRHARQFSVGRCFLAGDAAHVHTPAGGQGMNTGIQDAYNLAWKIAMVLRGNADSSLLESYNEERLANAKRLLQTTDTAFAAMTGSQWYSRFFRDKIMPSLAIVTGFDKTKEIIFPIISQIGINYHDSSLSDHHGDRNTVKAGDRMPYFLQNGENIYHKLKTPKFHLLVFSDGCDRHDLRSEVAEYGDWIDVRVIPLTPQVVEIFGVDKSFMVLLRPDNYIALSGNICLKNLQAYFERVRGDRLKASQK